MINLFETYCISEICFRHPYMIPLALAVILILIIIFSITFIKFSDAQDKSNYKSNVKKKRILMLFSRILIFLSLFIAMSLPYSVQTKMVQEDSSLTILSDNTTSFEVFDKDLSTSMASSLKGDLPVKLLSVGSGLRSNLGDGILNNIQGDDSILVISDGNNNAGKSLFDMLTFASSINSTVHALNIDPVTPDIGVWIEGPDEVITDVEETFEVIVNNIGDKIDYKLTITIDDNVYLSTERSGSETIKIIKKFSNNEYHTITAEITKPSQDHFEQNNVFYKTIKVAPRPPVVYVSSYSNPPLLEALDKVYDVTTSTSIPDDLENYMALILDDIPASDIQPRINQLTEYVADGNGILFVGGENSFERNYKGTLVETLLPVTVGAGEDQEDSDVNVMIMIDRSSGTGDHILLEKALAVSVLDSINENHNVGVAAFSAPGGVSPKIGIISPILPLKDHIDTTVNNIYRLTFDGQSPFDYGLRSAYTMLMDQMGSRNIIFISDGQTTNENLRERTRQAAIDIASKGVKIYVVGVGTDKSYSNYAEASSKRDDLFLGEIALLGNGIYFPADAKNRLKVLFGEPDQQEKEFLNSLVVLDQTHFITKNFDIDAAVTGYNYVIPKPSARMLVTTNKKIPMLVVWRFGLGRVAALPTDNGRQWSGELLRKNSSRLITRTVNWLVGDLNRNSIYDVSVKDTTLGNTAPILVTSSEKPVSEKFTFRKEAPGKYLSDFSSDTAGIFDVLEAKVAVNYYDEYKNLGLNQQFLKVINQTGGKVFDPDQTEDILMSVRSKSRKPKLEIINFSWLFALLSLFILLIEIIIRRLSEYRKNR